MSPTPSLEAGRLGPPRCSLFLEFCCSRQHFGQLPHTLSCESVMKVGRGLPRRAWLRLGSLRQPDTELSERTRGEGTDLDRLSEAGGEVKGCNLGCEATLSDSRYKDLSYTYMPSNQMFVVSKRLTDSWRAVGGGGASASSTRCRGAPPHYGHGSRGFWLDPALCVLCVPALQLGFWLRGVQP